VEEEESKLFLLRVRGTFADVGSRKGERIWVEM
jgi:hypothetical protein